MKYSTAVGHLMEMSEAANDGMRLRDSTIGWPLEELWVSGELLDGPVQLEAGAVVLVLDLPADELPWLAKHPTGEWIGMQLRLGKRPFSWWYRPAGWPVWNHENRRLVRFWSAGRGTHDEVIEAFRRRELGELSVTEPSDEELVEHLAVELAVSRRHLAAVLDRYWDHDWQRAFRRGDDSAEDTLWRAAQAVRELEEALASFGGLLP